MTLTHSKALGCVTLLSGLTLITSSEPLQLHKTTRFWARLWLTSSRVLCQNPLLQQTWCCSPLLSKQTPSLAVTLIWERREHNERALAARLSWRHHSRSAWEQTEWPAPRLITGVLIRGWILIHRLWGEDSVFAYLFKRWQFKEKHQTIKQ